MNSLQLEGNCHIKVFYFRAAPSPDHIAASHNQQTFQRSVSQQPGPENVQMPFHRSLSTPAEEGPSIWNSAQPKNLGIINFLFEKQGMRVYGMY